MEAMRWPRSEMATPSSRDFDDEEGYETATPSLKSDICKERCLYGIGEIRETVTTPGIFLAAIAENPTRNRKRGGTEQKLNPLPGSKGPGNIARDGCDQLREPSGPISKKLGQKYVSAGISGQIDKRI